MEISEEAREKREAYCGPDAADRIADLTRERDDLLAMKARVEALAAALAHIRTHHQPEEN